MKCQLCNQKIKVKPETMKDSIGKIPEFNSISEGLKDIIRIASDKRSHFLFEDSLNWEKVKFKAIQKISKKLLLLEKAAKNGN